MILLVPRWAANYEEFWLTIRRRNLWFIKLRYLAVLSLLSFLAVGEWILKLNFSSTQVIAVLTIDFSILSYNVLIHLIRPRVSIDPKKFNAMHLSLMQIILDLSALMLLVYFTGTIESPIYLFFIFHMVIGSLILPGYLIYGTCGVVIFVYSLLIYLQQIDLIDTHILRGIYKVQPDHPTIYIIIFILFFSAMMVITVLIANRIANNLLRREGQLRETLEKLNEAEKTKQKYIMGVVHEIKTPVSAVKSLVEIMLQKFLGPISDAIEEKLLRISERSNEALALINNILRISRLKLLEDTEKEPVFIEKIIEERIDEKLDLFREKNIKVTFQDTRTDSKSFIGDKDLIELAFSNLISNEYKYVEPGGHVLIKIYDENEILCVEISDDGIGIPGKDLTKIFDQFYRASNTKRNKTEGSGLGLSLVKEIVNHHRGTIKVESPSQIGNKNRPGSCFIIKLPYEPKKTFKKEEKIKILGEGL